MSKKDTFIIDSVRTPIGNLGGSLSTIRTDDLAAHVIKSLINRHDFDPGAIDDVIIGSNSFIGANCVILPGVKIGKKSIVSAGSVVHANVPDDTVVGGNPAVKLYKLK